MPVSAISSMFSKTLQTDAGLAQSIIGGIGMGKRQRELDRLQNPTYAPNQAINDYYTTAKDRYETDPYNSQAYTMAAKNARAGLATGLGALGDRRSATGQVGALVGQEQNQLQAAGVGAEKLRNQEFQQLGSATNMKSSDDRYAFDINQMMPFERKYQELSGRLASSKQLFNSGLNNLFGGLTGGGGGGLGGVSQLGGGISGGGSGAAAGGSGAAMGSALGLI